MALEDHFNVEELERSFEFLDSLRASGLRNPFHAQEPLQRAMNLLPHESFRVLQCWMEFIGSNLSARERAEAAIKRAALMGDKGG